MAGPGAVSTVLLVAKDRLSILGLIAAVPLLTTDGFTRSGARLPPLVTLLNPDIFLSNPPS